MEDGSNMMNAAEDYLEEKFDIKDVDITEDKISDQVNYCSSPAPPSRGSIRVKKESDIKAEPVELDLTSNSEDGPDSSFINTSSEWTPKKKQQRSRSTEESEESVANGKPGKKMLLSDNTANMAMVECNICKEGVRVMRQHVRQRHDITIAQYGTRYPEVRYALEMYHRYRYLSL
jgi:hypothetical protein